MKYLLIILILFSCSKKEDSLIIYNGRKSSLTDPIFKKFTEQTGIKVELKKGSTSVLRNIILQEKDKSPADLFYAQDSSSLCILSNNNLLDNIDSKILSKVDKIFISLNSDWVGISGRVRTLVYNSKIIDKKDLPSSINDLTSSKWKSKLGWAPKNSSFQSHITYMRKLVGDDKVTKWLEGMKNNDISDYPKNTPIVKAVIKGEIAAGLVNHYYLHRIKKNSTEKIFAENYFFPADDIGNFVNISGIAILKSSKNKSLAKKFIEFLLTEKIQSFFRDNNFEYPLLKTISKEFIINNNKDLNHKFIDFSELNDLEGTLKILRGTKVINY